MKGHLRSIAHRLGKLERQFVWTRRGTVTATDPLSVDLGDSGTDYTGVKHLSSYTPALGDEVMVLMWRGDLIVLDAIAPRVSVMHVGFNDSWSDQEVDMALAAYAQAEYVRIPTNWNATEATEGSFDWAYLDGAVAWADVVGLLPMFAPTFAPDFARNTGTEHAYPTDAKMDKYGNFCAALVTRFPTTVAVEAWNEPNYTLYGSYDNSVAVPADKVALLARAARIGLDGIDRRDVPVLLGGVTSIGGHEDYLTDVVAELGSGERYPVAIHAYGSGSDRVTESLDWVDTAKSIANGRDIWVTETGYATSETGSEAVQASALSDTLDGMLSRGVKTAIVHCLRDPSSGGAWEESIGMITNGGTHKTAYATVAGKFAEIRSGL